MCFSLFPSQLTAMKQQVLTYNVGSEMVGKLKIHLCVVTLRKLPELEAVRKCQLVPVPQSWGI